MKEYRYILASNKIPKLDCPFCGARKHWQRYIDTETGEVLPEQHGRCDNESKCGQWVTPKETGYTKEIWEQEQGNRSKLSNNWNAAPKNEPNSNPKPRIFIPNETFKQTLEAKRYNQNIFIQNLLKNVPFPFEAKNIEKVISHYYLGTVTSGYMKGAITFPYIDIKGNVRAIQVKQFDRNNKTIETNNIHSLIKSHCEKNNKALPHWLASYLSNEGYFTCLFGEHLLSKYPNSPIALVEAPKTAIYGTLYFGLPNMPKDLIWLGVYNKSSFNNLDKLKALQGRSVYVFPDLSKDGNTFKEWETKAIEHEARLKGTRFVFSDLLERLAPERNKSEGLDIADYLIKLDWRKFKTFAEPPPRNEPLKRFDTLSRNGETWQVEINQYGYPTAWDAPSPPTVCNRQPEAEPRTNLERLEEKNPNIKGLIQRFELELI